MLDALLWMLVVGGVYLFAPRQHANPVGPVGAFPWVKAGLVVSDWSLFGAAFVMAPIAFVTWQIPLWPLALVATSFVLWVMWAWAVSVWRR